MTALTFSQTCYCLAAHNIIYKFILVFTITNPEPAIKSELFLKTFETRSNISSHAKGRHILQLAAEFLGMTLSAGKFPVNIMVTL